MENLRKYLYFIKPKREDRTRFLVDVMLTFGLKIEDLCMLFGYELKYLENRLINENTYKVTSIKKLYRIGVISKMEAINNFLDYFTKVLESYQNKDIEKIKVLEEVIKDDKANKLMRNNYKPNGPLSNDEILIILKYQIKYMLSSEQIEKLFPIENSNYAKRVRKLQDSRLIAYFDAISDFYHYGYEKGVSK